MPHVKAIRYGSTCKQDARAMAWSLLIGFAVTLAAIVINAIL